MVVDQRDLMPELFAARYGRRPLVSAALRWLDGWARGDDPAPTFARLAADDRPIGEVLLDQSLFAGAGNVFRSEVLVACGVHPCRPASSLRAAEVEGLWAELAARMAAAVDGVAVPAAAFAVPALLCAWVARRSGVVEAVARRNRRPGGRMSGPTLTSCPY